MAGATVRPSKLYQYRKFSSQNLESLSESSIYLASYESFNDPFDEFNVAEPTHEQALEFCREMARDPAAKVADYYRKILNDRDALLSDFLKCSKDVIQLTEAKCRGLGIACLSEKADDLLMWSHYADGHTGYCLEFDGSVAPFALAMAVQYSTQRLKVHPYTLKPEDAHGMKALLVKHTCWAYEKEWRVLSTDGPGLSKYPPERLTAVYFGMRMSIERQKVILRLLGDGDKVLRVFQMKKSNSEFVVEPEPIAP